MLANQLARRGVRATIIDRHSGPALQTRALGVQARTLEIYAHLGIAERAVELGKRATGADMWARGRRMARVPLGDIGRDLSPYPYLLILGQDDNERLLGEDLRRWDMAVQWNTELVGLDAGTDRVEARLRQAGRTLAEVVGRVGRGMRRCAERGAQPQRHRVPGRAVRARVLRRRHAR